MINDKPYNNKEAFQGQKIPLEKETVVAGWNTVILKYMRPYNKNQVGLHTFIDGNDNQQYIYSDFEALHCFRVFPTFDQPNLKAKMQLTVICPKEWQAISNEMETRYEYSDSQKGQRIIEKHNIDWFLDFYDKESQEISICEFQQTPKIPTYLYALCAGPYSKFEDFDPQ